VVSGGPELSGAMVTLRPAVEADVPALATIRGTPAVRARWRGGTDLAAEIREAIADEGLQFLTIRQGKRIVGAIQWSAEEDPEYRHAGVDIFVDPAAHGRGIGTDAVRALVAYLIEGKGFHRIVIDPAADNVAAIRCYTKAGFRPVGIMRQYERGADGTWHDGLLMDLLADDVRHRKAG
jgi:aminoglycoside 6'-N-acetyltransferase